MISEQLTEHDVKTLCHKLGIEVKRTDSNGWATIKSPLRDEKNPSFGFNAKTGAWKDHSTGETGDIVTLVERASRQSTSEALKWIERELDITNALYAAPPTPPAPKSPPPEFWTEERLSAIKEAMKHLKAEPNHKLIETAGEYDCLKPVTLQKFGCGIVEQWGNKWLALPYQTGCQLYRRSEGSKEIRSMKGSRPGDTFFGLKQTTGKDTLFIAKSPRETMLLHQRYSDIADVIGLCTGEQGTVSELQRSVLAGLDGYDTIYTFLDCDTETAEETAQQFASEVKNTTESRVKIVNIAENTGGAYKDVTDCFRDGMDPGMIEAMLEDATNAISAKGNGADIKCKSATNAKMQQVQSRIDEALDVKKAPSIPDEVYSNLPELLKTRCSLINEPHRRDVFLMASLPVIAAHMKGVLAGHADGYYSPDLFTLVVANPGAGKGIAGKAKKMGLELSSYMIDKSRREKAEYDDLPDNMKIKMDEPRERVLFIPANSSSRAIYDTLEANGGSGLLFETEIDTLLNASGQEWGNFSDITRKAFHHESISINRKSERFFIENPRLSIFISGTFDQFKKMFESAENGHFSRYALYTFDVQRVWKSHRPTRKSRVLDESLLTASSALFDLYRRLSSREYPLYIDLKDEHWQAIDDTFAKKMQVIDDLDLSDYLHASNNRAAVLALRLVTMFTTLRTYEANPDSITQADSLTPSEKDMISALWLAETFIKHAMALYQILPDATDVSSKGTRFIQFIDSLPKEFTTQEALDVGSALDAPERTVKYWLSNDDRISRIQRGKYEKV